MIKKEKCDRPKRQLSCPPMATRSVNSGPWSLECLHDHVHGNAGVVSTSKNNSKQKQRAHTSKIVTNGIVKNKIKTGGKMKHSAHNFKKIDRLPVKDRKKVLKILMKRVNRRRGTIKTYALSDDIRKGSHVSDSSSSASVNNDWKNWVVLRGKEDVVKEDVNCFGKALWVKF